MSPELIQRRVEYFGWMPDIWALGVILYILVTGRYPFYGEAGEKDLHRKIVRCKYRWPNL